MLEHLPFLGKKIKDQRLERSVDHLLEQHEVNAKQNMNSRIAAIDHELTEAQVLLGSEKYEQLAAKIARIEVLKNRLADLEAYRMLAEYEKSHTLSAEDRNRRMELGIHLSGSSFIKDIFGEINKTEKELKSLEAEATDFTEYKALLSDLKRLSDEKKGLQMRVARSFGDE